MSLWTCPEHFITGPEQCCPLGKQIQLTPCDGCPSWDDYCDEYGCRNAADKPRLELQSAEPSIAHGQVPIPSTTRVLQFPDLLRHVLPFCSRFECETPDSCDRLGCRHPMGFPAARPLPPPTEGDECPCAQCTGSVER